MDAATVNEDWLRTQAWDLPTTLDGLVWAIGAANFDHDGQVQALRHFMTLPAWTIAPLDLERQVIAFAGEPIVNASNARARRYSEDQARDPDGKFAGGGSSAVSSAGPSTGSAFSSNFITIAATGPNGQLTAQDTAKIVGAVMNGGKVAIPPDHLPIVLNSMKGSIEPINLENVQVTGAGNENLFGRTALSDDKVKEISSTVWPGIPALEHGIPREAMPVIPGEPDQIDKFATLVASNGLGMQRTELDPRELRPTQNELNAPKVAGILGAMRGGMQQQTVVVDRNGSILDGHNRWAAAAAFRVSDDPNYKMPVMVVDTDITNLMKIGEQFDKANGIPHNSFGDVGDTTAKRSKLFSDTAYVMYTSPPENETPPDPHKAYIWFDGQWVLLATDAADDAIDYAGENGPAPETKAAIRNASNVRAMLLRYSEDQARDPDGKFSSGLDTSKLTAEGTSYNTEGSKFQAPIPNDEAEKNLQGYLDKGLASPAGQAAIDWYQDRHDQIENWAKVAGVTPVQYLGALAATSPHCPWETPVSHTLLNKGLADKACVLHLANPDVDPKTFAHSLESPGMMKTPLTNALLCLQGRPEEGLSAAKTRSFYNNINDPKGTHDVTIDTWMGRAIAGQERLAPHSVTAESSAQEKAEQNLLKQIIGGNTGKNTVGGQASADQLRYGWAADRVRSVAAANGITPLQAQAVIWTQVQKEGGYGAHE